MVQIPTPLVLNYQPKNAYHMYVKRTMPLVITNGIPATHRMDKIMKMWNELTPDQQLQFELIAEKYNEFMSYGYN